jgi:hypothetical protein
MTAIYHITHLRNLPNIIRDGGLWCDHIVSQGNLAHVSIAHQHIKERRAQKEVHCAAGGNLADYVPFYFAPRSPMLYAIHKGNVAGYQGGQAAVLHLVASAEQVEKSSFSFAFTDGHAEMNISRFFTGLRDLEHIDWKIMRETYWADTLEDGDRKRRRQAEFLVHRFFPLGLVETIGVINQEAAAQVMGLLSSLEPQITVQVQPTWYY